MQNQITKDSRLALAIEYATLKNCVTDTQKYFNQMWRNLRANGGMRLTSTGFQILKELKKDFTTIKVTGDGTNTGKLLVELDRHLHVPYYLTKKNIVIFDDMVAVQLILYNGDLASYLEPNK